jgi:hypothetical protein
MFSIELKQMGSQNHDTTLLRKIGKGFNIVCDALHSLDPTRPQ